MKTSLLPAVKLLSLLCLVLLGVASCGGDGDSVSSDTDNNPAAETSTSAGTPVSDTASDPADSDTESSTAEGTSETATPTSMAESLQFNELASQLPEGETDIEGVIAIAVESADHVDGDVEYAISPPAGGNHSGWWQNCGFYTQPLRNEHAVHSLEHGAVWVTYRADAPEDELDYLEQLAGRNTHLLVSPYQQQDTTFVLTAWGRQLALDSVGDTDFVAFLQTYMRNGPTAPEPGASCFGAIGVPPDRPLGR